MNKLEQFAFVLSRPPEAAQVDELLGRCPDVSVQVGAAESLVYFDRDAPSLVDAIVSGARDLAVAGLDPAAVRPDDDLVTIEIIAQRSGRDRDRIHRWAKGSSGPGGFPAPKAPHLRRPCYSWREVQPWLAVHFGLVPRDDTVLYRAVNLTLELRSMNPQVERMPAIRSLLWT